MNLESLQRSFDVLLEL